MKRGRTFRPFSESKKLRQLSVSLQKTKLQKLINFDDLIPFVYNESEFAQKWAEKHREMVENGVLCTFDRLFFEFGRLFMLWKERPKSVLDPLPIEYSDLISTKSFFPSFSHLVI